MVAPTDKTAEWIARVQRDNPCAVVLDEAGKPTANIRTCPVRLGFPHLFEKQKAMDANGKDKHSTVLLFQDGADLSVLQSAALGAASKKWGDQFATYKSMPSFHNPFRDQGEKPYEGFVAGRYSITASSERPPAIVDGRMAPVIDPDKVYPGVWAICLVRPFAFETRNPQGIVVKRGQGFGLQSVMIVADDIRWGGGSVDVNKAFAGVSIEASVNPSALFGQTPATAGAEPSAASLL